MTKPTVRERKGALRRLLYKTGHFPAFFYSAAQKWPNGVKFHASRLKKPLLFCDRVRRTKAGAGSWQSHLFVKEEARSVVYFTKRAIFQQFFKCADQKWPNGVKFHASRVKKPLLFCDRVQRTKAGAGRDKATFSWKKRRAPASTLQNGPFSSIFL